MLGESVEKAAMTKGRIGSDRTNVKPNSKIQTSVIPIEMIDKIKQILNRAFFIFQYHPLKYNIYILSY